MKKVKKIYVLLFGALIGVINGFFGGGGGMVVVPLLTKLFEVYHSRGNRENNQWITLYIIWNILSEICIRCTGSWDGFRVWILDV